ncbi:MAG: hypothetical protein EXS09_19920 [Gemmataceae bacterium]|nr:hypothetical protein [Gemmataceae bacterium]
MSEIARLLRPTDRTAVRQKMLHWQQDRDLAGLRDVTNLAKLSPEEQKTFTQLWSDVAAVLKKAEEKVK